MTGQKRPWSSRDIIWKHAAEKGWRGFSDINGNPAVDAFHKGDEGTVPYPNPPSVIVWYSRDGRTVVDCTHNGYALYRHRRDDVIDILDGHR